MKWIRISERQPENINDWYIVRGITKPNKPDYIFWNDVIKSGGIDVAFSRLPHDIEWLDESPSAPVEQEGQEGMWDEIIEICDSNTYKLDLLLSKYTITKK